MKVIGDDMLASFQKQQLEGEIKHIVEAMAVLSTMQ